MRVCVVGGGGREHALAAVLGRSAEVVVTPGNPGIAGSVSVPVQEIDADLYVIGPEGPLVAGLADQLRDAGRLVFGPGGDGARLEGSKAWMKEVLAAASVPTARHQVFTEVEPALAFMATLAPPYVVKTDGLAAGKGVLVTDSLADAADDVAAKLSGAAFGAAGRRVVIEEGLAGPEVSLMCLCDGQRAVALAPAQDFKRLEVGDAGPNTGGMGAYSPVPFVGPELVDDIMERAVLPTLHTLRSLGVDYRGVLYAGIMITADGPRVLEYNVRFGDPEAQVVLPRLDCDLTALLAEAAGGALRSEPSFSAQAAVTVVAASAGYPGSPLVGSEIDGVEPGVGLDGDGLDGDRVEVFYAGVARNDDGRLVTAGGRVLSITGLGADLGAARDQAYAAMAKISWPGMQYRTDIAAGR